jgi:hypothetical protein
LTVKVLGTKWIGTVKSNDVTPKFIYMYSSLADQLGANPHSTPPPLNQTDGWRSGVPGQLGSREVIVYQRKSTRPVEQPALPNNPTGAAANCPEHIVFFGVAFQLLPI